MARINKARGGKPGSGDVLTLTTEDFKGRSFKTAAPGKYRARFSAKSSIQPNAEGTGNVLKLMLTITATASGGKTEAKGITVFDNIAPHVGWKIAQVLKALGIAKPPKKMTLADLLEIVLKHGKEIRIVIGRHMYKGKKQNDVAQYLTLKPGADEEPDDSENDDSDDDDEDDDDADDDDDDDDSDDDDEDDDDADDDDDDEPAPRKRAAKKAAPARRNAKKRR